jgi:hypothetical protein
MVTIRGRQRRSEWKIKRDIDGFRVNAGKLETIDKSFYLEREEKVMYNLDTKE